MFVIVFGVGTLKHVTFKKNRDETKSVHFFFEVVFEFLDMLEIPR